MSSIYEDVISLGIDHSNHETDLYIPANRKTADLIKKYYATSIGGTWFPECNCRISCCVSKFTCQIDMEPWYDIAFAYTPGWRNRR